MGAELGICGGEACRRDGAAAEAEHGWEAQPPACCPPLPAQFAEDGSFDSQRGASFVRPPRALAAAGGVGSALSARDRAGPGVAGEDLSLGLNPANYFRSEAAEAPVGEDGGGVPVPDERSPVDSDIPISERANDVTASAPRVRVLRTHTFKSGAQYTGQWLGGARDGFGEQRWPDGAFYQGMWASDAAEGHGKLTHSNGDAYVGQWRDNKAHGFGVYRHANRGSAYAGEFRDDLQDGLGVETWGERGRYEGWFAKGRKHGFGVYAWPDGSSFCGSWRNGHMDGPGEYDGADGRRFMGQWQVSQMHGDGECVWWDGRRYRGQYQLGAKDGFGVFSWPDGRRYEGEWQAGNQHGHGQLRMVGGDGAGKLVVRGVWAKGQRVDAASQ